MKGMHRRTLFVWFLFLALLGSYVAGEGQAQCGPSASGHPSGESCGAGGCGDQPCCVTWCVGPAGNYNNYCGPAFGNNGWCD